MRRVLLRRGGELHHARHVGAATVRLVEHHLAQTEAALGERAGLVECEVAHPREQLKLRRRLDQHAPARERRHRTRVGQRHRHDQRARARDDDEGEGAPDPPHARARAVVGAHPPARPALVLVVAAVGGGAVVAEALAGRRRGPRAPPERYRREQDGAHQHSQRVRLREALEQQLSVPKVLRRRHEAAQLRRRAVGRQPVHTDREHAALVCRARVDRRALLLADGDRLAGEHRLVDARGAADDGAVDWHRGTRLDEQQLASHQLRDRLVRRAVGRRDQLGEHAAEASRRVGRVVDAPDLQPLRGGEEEDDRRRLPQVEQHERANACDCHRGEHIDHPLPDQALGGTDHEGRHPKHDARDRKVGEGVLPPLGGLRARPDAASEDEEDECGEGEQGSSRAQLTALDAALAAALLYHGSAEARPVERAQHLLHRDLLGVKRHRHPTHQKVELEVHHAVELAQLLLDQHDFGLAAHAGDHELGDREGLLRRSLHIVGGDQRGCHGLGPGLRLPGGFAAACEFVAARVRGCRPPGCKT